jgi:acyl-CoA synthetase (AMP-forming)/AMP-acid ligase II
VEDARENDVNDSCLPPTGLEFNLADALTFAAELVPDRTAIIQGDKTLTFAQLTLRARRIASWFQIHDLSQVTERKSLANHESGQAHLGQLLYNSPEYLEGMFGAFYGRLAPFNINYRYVADEVRYVLKDASPRVLQYNAVFAPLVADALQGTSVTPILLQVADLSGNKLLPGAIDYEEAIESVPDSASDPVRSPDDLYVLYTGGTTGMPKGVMWRQADLAVAALGLTDRRNGKEWSEQDERVGLVSRRPNRNMTCAPFIHGAAQWNGLQTLCDGDTLVLSSVVDHLDAVDIWSTVERERVTSLSIVGDAFAGPLLDELSSGRYDVSSLKFVLSGGAALRRSFKSRLIELIPGVRVQDLVGSSESGTQGRTESVGPGVPRYRRTPSTVIISEDMTIVLEPDHEGSGWLAQRGRLPLGYLGDQAKTARAFPLIDGIRYGVPGDRARLKSEDEYELLGRDSVTINTGGEKVFGEEVELVIKELSQVEDVLVCGRPSDRWGQEIVAIVVTRNSISLDQETVKQVCRDRLARYKVPREVVFTNAISRSPAGKPDYRWALSFVSGDGHSS